MVEFTRGGGGSIACESLRSSRLIGGDGNRGGGEAGGGSIVGYVAPLCADCAGVMCYSVVSKAHGRVELWVQSSGSSLPFGDVSSTRYFQM